MQWKEQTLSGATIIHHYLGYTFEGVDTKSFYFQNVILFSIVRTPAILRRELSKIEYYNTFYSYQNNNITMYNMIVSQYCA